jgi:hypothetical protein
MALLGSRYSQTWHGIGSMLFALLTHYLVLAAGWQAMFFLIWVSGLGGGIAADPVDR